MKRASEPTVTRPAPFEHLFVATDFSTSAAEALSRAARLPIAERGRVTVAHVLPDRLPKTSRAEAETAARRSLEQAAASLSRVWATLGRRDLRVASELLRGQPYVEIVRHARLSAADLVVLGRHGARPVRDMFIGSTAERVIRAGDLAVLVVSGRAGRPYRRPVLAVDLADTCRSVITVALRALEPEVASATMVHAYHVPFEEFMTPGVSRGELTELRSEYRDTAAARLARLQASLGDLGLRWQTVILRGEPRTVILGQAVKHRADLLAIGTHGRSGIAHALLGSVAEWVIRAAACDVLVARPAKVSFELP